MQYSIHEDFKVKCDTAAFLTIVIFLSKIICNFNGIFKCFEPDGIYNNYIF